MPFNTFFIIILLVSFPCIINAYTTDSLPPQAMPEPWDYSSQICRPRGTSFMSVSQHFICDPSGLLSPRKANKIESIIDEVYEGHGPYSLVKCHHSRRNTQDDEEKGFKIAIALIRRMPFDGNTLEQRATNYANDLFSHWQLSNNCGASVLIFVSLADKRMYIATGQLATKYLNQHQIYKIYGRMVPMLKNGNLDKALFRAVKDVAKYLKQYNGKHAPPSHHTEAVHGTWSGPLFLKGGPSWWDLLMSLTVITCAFMLIFACCNGVGGIEASRKKRERRHVRRKLDIIRREYIAAMLPQYIPTTCPMCQDDLTPPWEPTVPTLPSTEEDQLVSSQQKDETPPRRTRTLRCGQTFHEDCLEDELNMGHEGEINGTTRVGTICPVCGDPGMGTTPPRSLSDTRQENIEFRLRKLSDEYPHILTPAVIDKLTQETPNLWPESMTESYMTPSWTSTTRQFVGEADQSQNDLWNGVRGILSGVAIGGLAYGAFSAIGNLFSGGNDENRSYYTGIPSSGGDGPTGGAGAGWGNAISNAASRFTGNGGGPSSGYGFGWGGGNNNDGDGPSSGAGFGW